MVTKAQRDEASSDGSRAESADRRAGAALVSFVVVQLAYLVLLQVVASPPALDGPIDAIRAFVREHAVNIRVLPLLAVVNFVLLFVPGSVGLGHRLRRSAPRASLWPELVVPGVLMILVSVCAAAVGYAALGLVPTQALSDSTLRAAVKLVEYSIFDVGSIATALFLSAASLAILRSERAPGWLGWWGLATALASIVGALWIVSADLGSALYASGLLARGSFLLWVATTGAWLYRSAPAATRRPTLHTEPLSA